MKLFTKSLLAAATLAALCGTANAYTEIKTCRWLVYPQAGNVPFETCGTMISGYSKDAKPKKVDVVVVVTPPVVVPPKPQDDN